MYKPNKSIHHVKTKSHSAVVLTIISSNKDLRHTNTLHLHMIWTSYTKNKHKIIIRQQHVLHS